MQRRPQLDLNSEHKQPKYTPLGIYFVALKTPAFRVFQNNLHAIKKIFFNFCSFSIFKKFRFDFHLFHRCLQIFFFLLIFLFLEEFCVYVIVLITTVTSTEKFCSHIVVLSY